MKVNLEYNTNKYEICQSKWSKNYTSKTESIMALGNGYLGLRSVDEEIANFNKENLFVNGVFNKENEKEISELANLADSIQNAISIDGEIFSLKPADTYLKTLEVKKGILSREITFSRQDKCFQLKFERFVSQAKKKCICSKNNFKTAKRQAFKSSYFSRN